jgi:prepilin signal peptidase PulO-like enzyme (type II secretory pathway)
MMTSGLSAVAQTAGFAVLFALAALVRAKALGDQLGTVIPLVLVVSSAAMCAWCAPLPSARAIALAYLAVCGWTDLRVRRVYLPVSCLAGVALACLAAGERAWVAFAIGLLTFGAFGLVLHYGTRGTGFGLGDVANWALLGAGFGWHRALWAVGIGSTLAAVVFGVLIALRVVPRTYRIPMAYVTLVGAIIVQLWSIGGPG